MSETPTPYTTPSERSWPQLGHDGPWDTNQCYMCHLPFDGPTGRQVCHSCYQRLQHALASQPPRDPEPAEGIIRQIRNLLDQLEHQIL